MGLPYSPGIHLPNCGGGQPLTNVNIAFYFEWIGNDIGNVAVVKDDRLQEMVKFLL
jgi:hypothetical protein